MMMVLMMMTILMLVMMIDDGDDDDDTAALADEADLRIKKAEDGAAQNCPRSRRPRPRLKALASGRAST